MQRIPWLIVILIAPDLLGASAAATVTFGDEHCRTIRFRTGWHVSAQAGPIDQFEFRKTESNTEQYLMAALVPGGSARRSKKEYSGSKFRVDFGDSAQVRPVSEDEWDRAIPASVGERFRLGLQHSRRADNFVFRQKAFKRSGPKWPVPGDDARISPDEKWIAVQSWQGSDYRDGDGLFLPGSLFGTPSRFFVDLYEVESGDKIAAFDGIDHDFNAGDAPLVHSFWLDSRFFIVPLGSRREKLLVCEVPGERHGEHRQPATF